MEVEATAPGKVFLVGEYAVALGGPAIVAAVDRRLGCRARRLPGAGRLTVRNGPLTFVGPLHREQLDDVPTALRFAVSAARVSARAFGLEEANLAISTWSHLDGDGPKVGLGGSAAIVAAVTGAVQHLSGRRTVSAIDRAALGVAAHRFAQGGGSGGDVVSSTLGGLQWVNGLDASQVPTTVSACCAVPPVEVQALELPTDLALEIVATGESVQTGPRVRRFVAQARDSGAGALQEWMAGMAVASDGFRDACADGHGDGALAAYRLARRLLGRLGALTGIRIWTEALRRACDALEGEPRVAIKPSGAGGGDCAVAVADTAHCERLRETWRAADLVPLEAALSPDGVRVREVREEGQDG